MVWQNDITDQAAAAMASIGIPPNPLGEAEQTDEIVGGNEGTTSDESSKKCNEMESQDSGSENEGIQIISSVPVNQEREPDPGMSAKDEATEDMNTRMIGTPEVEQDQEPEPEVATEGEAVAAIGNDEHIKKEGTGFESIGETKKEAKESEVLGNEEARSEEEEVEDMIAPHEAAFIGSIDVTQKDDNQEKPQSVQKEEVGVDDAVPVDNTQAPEEQPAAEKSVYSSSGTETDDSLCVDDRGYSSVTKAPDSTILLGGCPRRLRLYLFSLTIIGMIVGAIVALLFGMGLMGAGRANGSLRATSSATVSPTASPTKSPTFAPVPTASPTVSPTAAPTSDPLLNILKVFSKDRLENTTSPQYHAYEWMRSEDTIIKNPDVDPLRIYQRYALITLYTSLVGEIPSYASDDECTWPRVTCGTTNVVSLAKAEDWQVTELKMAGTSSKGPIPAEIGLLAPSLVHLDLAENPDLNGSIPDEVYSLTRLKNLYLHNCALTGTLREAVANLELLEGLFLGNNKFTGTIPTNLGSPDRGSRPLRKVILHHNQFEGAIPENLNLPDAMYVDLSFNKLNSTIPFDLGTDFTSLRQLYLDHNNITGTIPESLSITGTSALITLDLSNNMLTGGIPASWVDKDAVSTTDTVNVENNIFKEKIDKNICDLGVFNGGQLVEFSADCDICGCRSLCANCRDI